LLERERGKCKLKQYFQSFQNIYFCSAIKLYFNITSR
jgi:hypothetical protein